MITDERKLFRILNLETDRIYIIALLLMSVGSVWMGGWRTIFAGLLVALFMLRVGPDVKTYAVLGLSRATWKTHRLHSLWMHALLFTAVGLIVGTVVRAPWTELIPLLVFPLLIAGFRGVRTPSHRPFVEREKSVAKTQEASAPEGMVMIPQLKIWRDIWVSILVFVVAIQVWELMGSANKKDVSFLMVCLILLALFRGVDGTIRGTLRQWTALGFSRDRWVKLSLLTALVNPLAALLVYQVYALTLFEGPYLLGIIQFLLIGALVPLSVLSADLANKRTAWLPVLGIVLGVAVFVQGEALFLPALLTILGTVLMISCFKAMAARVEVFNHGVSGWFGISTSRT